MKIRRISLPELSGILPHAVSELSMVRASILTDQIHAVLREREVDRLIVLVVEDALDGALAAVAMALRPQRGDAITLLHMQSLRQPLPDRQQELSRRQLLSETLWRGLVEHLGCPDRTFIQWATDPVSEESGYPMWPACCHFQLLGTLQYLARDFSACTESVSAQKRTAILSEPIGDRLELATELSVVPTGSAEMLESFSSLVQRTYEGSLDCPLLERFRNAPQIVQGYRNSPTFSPDLWFTIHEGGGTANDSLPMGCLLLARHPSTASNPDDDDAPVLELVYMGVLPEYRGRGLGQQIMQHVQLICQAENASKLILAVDETNHPAHDTYLRFEMQSILRESVWARLI